VEPDLPPRPSLGGTTVRHSLLIFLWFLPPCVLVPSAVPSVSFHRAVGKLLGGLMRDARIDHIRRPVAARIPELSLVEIVAAFSESDLMRTFWRDRQRGDRRYRGAGVSAGS